MRSCKNGALRVACYGLVLGMFVPGARQAAAQTPSATKTSSGKSSEAELPDSPGALLAKTQQTSPLANPSEASGLPASPQAQASQAQASQSQTSQSQTSQAQLSQTPSAQPMSQPSRQRPVGTAAAEAPLVSGVAASEPAGVAIAPAKQHRVRTIVLRTGALLGAGVALGSVAALTEATPSKPPGAH